MKRIGLALVLCTIAAAAVAQTSTCSSRADDKKLAGAALTSFMKKCKKDAMKSCDASAIDKNLSGAARTSFTKKCVTDAIGG
jgi:psiF repeat